MKSEGPSRTQVKTKALAALVTLLAAGVMAGDVLLDTIDFAGRRTTNRTFLVTPLSLTNVPAGRLASYDPIGYSTGTNGYAWVSNMLAGVYQVELLGPPRTTRHTVLVDTNGGMETVTTTQNTLPPGGVAYSAAAADARFAPIGSGGADRMPTNNGTAYNSLFYNPTFGDEVGSMTVSELAVSGSLNVQATGTVMFAQNQPALSYNPLTGFSWLKAIVGMTNANGSPVIFGEDLEDYVARGGGSGIQITNESTGKILTIDADADLAEDTTIRFPSGLTPADGSIGTNQLSAAAMSWIASQGSGGGGQATNVFNIAVTGESSNSAAAVALWTNSVPVSNTFSVTFRAVSGGPTNATGVAFMTRETLFWRGGGDLLWIGSNTVSRIGSTNVDFYCTTNSGSNVVLYARAYGVSTNEHVEYKADGFTQMLTNGWAAAAGGGGGEGSSLTNGLLAYWPLDDTNNLVDLSANGRSLWMSDADITNRVGVITNGVYIPGTVDSPPMRADHDDFSVADGKSLTIAGWFYPTYVATTRTWISKWAGSPSARYEWKLYTYDSPATLIFAVSTNNTSDGTFAVPAGNLSITANSGWYFACAQIDNTNKTVRLLLGTATDPGAWSTNSFAWPSTPQNTGSVIVIGEQSDTYALGGIADEVAVWNRMLTDAEVLSLWQSQTNAVGYPFQ